MSAPLLNETTPSRTRTVFLGALLLLCAAASARALSVVASFPIAITNNQAVGSAATLQQPVTFNPSLFADYEAADLGNIRFCADSACATPLNAWLESCSPTCATTASSATAWVQLTSAVPATGAATIYLGFMTTSTNFDGVLWGESIDIAPGFDNGSSVFAYYNNGQTVANFTLANGGSLTTTVFQNPLGVSTNVITLDGNGAVTASNETVAWYDTPVAGDDMIIEGWVNIGPTNLNALHAVRGASATALINYLLGDGWTGDAASVVYESGAGTNTLIVGNGARTASQWLWSLGTASGTALSDTLYSKPLELGGTVEFTASGTDTNVPGTNQFVGVGTWAGSNAASYFYQWRVRANPPAGVQPTASVAPPVQQCDGVILKNASATTATPVPYQQSLTFYPTSYATLERPDLGNIRYCADDQCQTQLYAWLGGCAGSGAGPCSPTAASAVAWVQLASAIPAGGTQTIYQCFLTTNVTFDANYWGESADIGAGGDNGSNVFTYYNNGQTTTGLNLENGGALAAVATVANPYGVDSGIIRVTAKNGGGTQQTVAWYDAAVAGNNFIIEGWVDRDANQAAMLAARGATDATETDYMLGAGWGGAAADGTTLVYENANAATALSNAGAYPAAGWLWTQGTVSGSGLGNALYNKQPELGGVQASTTSATNAALPATDEFVGIAARANGANAAYFYQWRVRVYFPSSTSGVTDSTAPAAVTNFDAADIATSSAALSWTAPTDANVTSVYPSISEYAIQYASYTAGVVWSTADAQISISTSGVTAGSAQGAFVTGLNANTTYYFRVWSQDPGLLWSPISNGATMQTLADPITTGAPISITASSVTVNWTALPASPQSSASEGYELNVSTTNFTPGDVVYTSTTPNGLLSTLAVAGLNTGTTMYFRVATFNYSRAPDYVYLSSANIQISPSIATLVMGLDSTVQFSTVSVSSVVITNVGNLPLTLTVSGSTITAGSPWVLSVSSGVEAPVLQGEWNSTQPASASFATPITNTPVVSATGGNYAGGQSGQSVPSGGKVTMWFKFWAPTSTTAANMLEVLQVLYQSGYP